MKRNPGKSRIAVSMIAAMSLAAAACGSDGDQAQKGNSSEGVEPAKQQASQPITLFFYTAQNSNYANEENFQREIGSVITAKFPHITIKHTHRGTGKDYTDLITAGEIPDIILESRSNVHTRIIGNGLDYDLTDMIKTYKFDLSRIQKPVLQQMINSNQTGKIYGLPFSVNAYVNFYNKDIFDKFGVPYPVNGMTWDETYELAKRLTRTDNGTAYHGFQAYENQFLSYNALSLSPLSLTEDRATMQTPEWSRLLTDRKRFYEIPGNTYVPGDDFPKGYIAMVSHVSEMVIGYPQKNPAMNWDVAALPSYPDKPKTGLQANAYFLFISKTSKYKDQAFQVIDYLLSDEVQTQLSKVASLTPLVSKSVQQSFGESIPHLKGKHLDALFYNEYAMPPAPRSDRLIYFNVGPIYNDFMEMISKNLDVNTTLRQMDEKINKGIQEEKAKSVAK